MKRSTLLLVASALFLTVASPLMAQVNISGCVDSPENPTVVLALVGSAGALLASARNRFAARSRNRNSK